MPRFFIDADDGEHDADDGEGYDVADAKAARDLAVTGLKDMVWHGDLADRDLTFSVVVRDAAGGRVYVARLRFESEWVGAPNAM